MFFLGVITGASGAAVNVGGFEIPKTAKAIYLQPDASGLQFELAVPTSPTGTFLTSATRAAFLNGPNVLSGPFRLPAGGNRPVVSIYNAAGGSVTVRVYGAPTS